MLTCADSLPAIIEIISRSFGRQPDKTFPYFDLNGALVGLVCRWNQSDGKAIRPLSLDPLTGQWCRKAMPSPRPLFHLPELIAAPAQTAVWLVEGEPAAEAFAGLLLRAGQPDVCVTWSGGCAAWRQTDFSPLRGRLVRLWPDNDQPGRLAMREIAAHLVGLGCRAEWIDPADRFQLPEHADAADVAADFGLVGCTTAEAVIDTLLSLARPPELNALDRGEFPTGDGTDGALLKRQPVRGPLEAALRKPQPTTAERLVGLALERFRLLADDAGAPFAEALDRPGFVRPLRGGDGSLRAELARAYRDTFGRPPNAAALADALLTLEGECLGAPRQPVWLRVASLPGGGAAGVVLDLGRADGKVAIVEPGAWRLEDAPPAGILFRRTALTGELPLPRRGGSLAELRDLVNIASADWPLVAGWLAAALVPDMPHPILLLTGLQGVGKSTAARMLVSLIDPSPVPLRSEPKDLDHWLTASSGSWVVTLDNISGVPGWLSDALCRAATGDGLVKRRLYTDGDLHVVSLRRVIAMTSIDAGALRGDLGDRLLLVELEPIDDAARRPEAEIGAEFEAVRPRILGALLDALAAALAGLPRVQLRALPRMADFGKLLAAFDQAGVTNGAMDRYFGMRDRVAGEVLEGDPFAIGVLELVRSRGGWLGTASELLADLLPGGTRPPTGWPTPNRVVGRLRRLAPALKSRGVDFVSSRTRAGRRIELRLSAGDDW